MPFRRPRPKPDSDGFYPAATVSDVVEGRPLPAMAGQDAVLLVRLGDEIRAVGRYCPHAAGDFARGEQVRHKLICPEHDYKFDIRNGRILWPEDETYCLRRFDVRVTDGTVFVRQAATR